MPRDGMGRMWLDCSGKPTKHMNPACDPKWYKHDCDAKEAAQRVRAIKGMRAMVRRTYKYGPGNRMTRRIEAVYWSLHVFTYEVVTPELKAAVEAACSTPVKV